jgi:hypothetical protein
MNFRFCERRLNFRLRAMNSTHHKKHFSVLEYRVSLNADSGLNTTVQMLFELLYEIKIRL